MGFKKGIFATLFIFFYGIISAQNVEFVLQVDPVMQELLMVADTDGDKKITIEDAQKRHFWMVSKGGDSVAIEKIYFLSNLLQELATARNEGKSYLELSFSEIKEPPFCGKVC